MTMLLEVVCSEKVLTIGFEKFPSRIRSFAGHDVLSDVLCGAIPEMRDGLEGGIYAQMKHVWITVECEGMSMIREQEIRETFLRLLKEHCRLK
jgi:hypothetical protein